MLDEDYKWQERIYENAKKLADKRYTPQLNVDLPINQSFDGLARNEKFYTRIRKLYGELRKSKNDIFPRNNPDLLGLELINFDYCFEELLLRFSEIKEYSTIKIHWDEIKEIVKKLDDYSWKLQRKISQVQDSADNAKKEEHTEKIFNSESYYISRFRTPLHELGELIDSDAAKLSNSPFLLLNGVTGIGKTHLLCDLVKKRISENSFSFISLGQEFNGTDDIWKQIIKKTDNKALKSKTTLLKKFDQLGVKTKSRFFIIIDALNESQNAPYWKMALPILLKDIKHYPNIALVISVRSGFEKEVITTSTRKRFHEVEHVGFRFREWEAIKEFFTQFGIPLPEIPLINQEFSVPLFLLLFCKSRQRRAKRKAGKQLFRGHEGSTSIFEDFIKGVSENIGKEFCIGSVDKVWNKLIKPLAEGMVNNRGHKDRISEFSFKKLLSKELPGVDFGQLTSSLEKNHLVIRIPHYNKQGKRTSFDYRFTYQRFSDHLIARYLMNKYADKRAYGTNTTKNLKSKMQKNGTIGKFLTYYSLKGVVDALSIQVPERLDGEELIDLCPWAKQMLEESFLESIIWRDPKAFYLNKKGSPEKTIKIINSLILPFEGGHSKFFSTVLNVAGVPNHPFNAFKIHSYLKSLGMAARDHLWSPFLYYDYGENGVVDRLLHWVLSASFNKVISDQPKLLIGIILTWFLTSSHRSVRDKATKGLVILLENSPTALLKLNQIFVDVDDLYVIERLYAVNYGVILRLSGYKDPSLKKLAGFIYTNIFLAKKPVAHILIRDYAKCSLDVLMREKVYLPPYPTKVSAVLNTKWPKRIPTIKTLENKFEPKNFSWEGASYQDRGVRAIWNSFDGIGDFFRYGVEPAISNWSNVNKNEPIPTSIKDLEEEFSRSLNRDQSRLYKQIRGFNHVTFIRMSHYLKIDKENLSLEEEKQIKEENRLERLWKQVNKSFWVSLSKDQKVLYRQILRRTQYRYPRKLGQFNSELAKRWILKRVFELYNPRYHGHFDGIRATHQDYSRTDSPAERIGKKYQWIALHELLGYLADNYRFLINKYSPEYGEYKGAWQIGSRDIDPSCITLDKPNFENSPWQPNYDAWRVKESNEKWLKRRADLPNPITLATYTDSTNKEWFILNSYFGWQQDIPPEEERYHYPSRDIFYLWYSYLIKNDDLESLTKWFKNQNFYGRWMPEVRDGIRECFFREFPQSDVYKSLYSQYINPPDGWITKVGWHKKMPGSIMEVYDEFSITSASRDKSVEESFHIGLPSSWLIKYMGLKESTHDGFWVDSKGNEVCGDLSLREGGKSVLAVEKKSFLSFLRKHKLSLIWTLLGEKAVFGNERGKIQKISGAYVLQADGSISGKFKLTSDSGGR